VPPPRIWYAWAIRKKIDGSVYRLEGRAMLESATMRLQADEIEWDQNSGEVQARGNIYFQNFESNEKLWAERAEYNTETERGKFWEPRGMGQPRIDARPGILTSTNPYYFQGEMAERIGMKYILYNGFVTNCKVPNSWWIIRGPKFDIIPGERVIAYRTVFRLRGFPLFYTPFFYKSLEKVPRRTGFLTPSLGNSSRRGKMFGVGYFWAINRS